MQFESLFGCFPNVHQSHSPLCSIFTLKKTSQNPSQIPMKKFQNSFLMHIFIMSEFEYYIFYDYFCFE